MPQFLRFGAEMRLSGPWRYHSSMIYPRREPTRVPHTVIWLLSKPIVWSYRFISFIFQLDRRGAESNLRRLREEVEIQCADLFARYGGRIVPELSSGLPSFDFASVVVEVRSVLLRATRDRASTDWSITSSTSDLPWQPLESVCKRFAAQSSRYASSFGVLFDHLPEIEALFKEGYSA